MKVIFLDRPLLTPIGNDGEWEWGADFRYTVDNRVYLIRAGRTTDLDSVPRLPLIYWIAKNRARIAAGIHDDLYMRQEGKDYADDAFWAAMLTEGVRQPYRGMIYGAVKAFGQSSYDKYGVQST